MQHYTDRNPRAVSRKTLLTLPPCSQAAESVQGFYLFIAWSEALGGEEINYVYKIAQGLIWYVRSFQSHIMSLTKFINRNFFYQ